jgi:hypothetical protein
MKASKYLATLDKDTGDPFEFGNKPFKIFFLLGFFSPWDLNDFVEF